MRAVEQTELGALWPHLSPSAGSAVFERVLCSISGMTPQNSPASIPRPFNCLSFLPFPPLKAQIAGALLLSSVPPPSSAFLHSLSLALCISSLCLFLTLLFLGRSLTHELFFKSFSQFSVN